MLSKCCLPCSKINNTDVSGNNSKRFQDKLTLQKILFSWAQSTVFVESNFFPNYAESRIYSKINMFNQTFQQEICYFSTMKPHNNDKNKSFQLNDQILFTIFDIKSDF